MSGMTGTQALTKLAITAALLKAGRYKNMGINVAYGNAQPGLQHLEKVYLQHIKTWERAHGRACDAAVVTEVWEHAVVGNAFNAQNGERRLDELLNWNGLLAH